MTARRDPASERQIQAADPAASTWLSANAGSGKTRVLIDRLLGRVEDEGLDIDRFLVITYTKAAAAEMQARLFERLGKWAVMDDGELSGALAELDDSAPSALDPARLSEARRLFARALETPGGLKGYVITARGYANDAVIDASTGRVISGAEVWLQSTLTEAPPPPSP